MLQLIVFDPDNLPKNPKKLKNIIDHKTSLIMESGVHKCFEPFSTFFSKLREQSDLNGDIDDFQPINLQQYMITI